MPVRPEDFDASPWSPTSEGSRQVADSNTRADQERAKSLLAHETRSMRDPAVALPLNGNERKGIPAYVIALLLVAAVLGAGTILLPSLRTGRRTHVPVHKNVGESRPSGPPVVPPVAHKEPPQQPIPLRPATPQAPVARSGSGIPVYRQPSPASVGNLRPPSRGAIVKPDRQGAVFGPGSVTAAQPPTVLPPTPPAQQTAPLSPTQPPNDPKLMHRPPPAAGAVASVDAGSQSRPVQREETNATTATTAHVAPPYTGPTSGILTWQGEVHGTALVVIEKSGPNFGTVSGSPLPGVLCMVQISDPKHFSMAVAPAPSNQWQKLVLNVHGNGVMTVRLNWALP